MKISVWQSAVVAALFLGSAGVCAQDGTGPYLGISAGSTHFKISALDYSTDKFSWGAFGGYQFTPYIGAEVGYLQAKKITEPVGSATLRAKGSAFTGSVLGTLAMSERWSVFGRLGGARTKVKAAVVGGASPGSASDSSTELIYGAGIATMLDGAKIRLEYQRIDGDDVKVGTVSLGIVWLLGANR